MTARAVGIEAIGVHPCTLALPMSALCAARGHDPADVRDQLMVDERSMNPLWEDPVTMAVNAAQLVVSERDRERIELVIVASESGVDQEKPLSTWVHRHLGLSANCRNFEIKHACYGGTAGLRMALGWIASGMARGAKALVVATDQSRMHLGQPWEFVLGAGAAAVLVSDSPRLLEIDLDSAGYYTEEVSDLTRPTSRVETGNSETSLFSYMAALDGAYDHFLARAGEPVDFDTFFRWNVYHAPFGGMTFRAHKALLGRAGITTRAAAWAHFSERSLPALRHVRRMGGTYSASTFIGLLGLVDGQHLARAGDRVGIFSYGSGCAAEMYAGRLGDAAEAAARAADLTALLDARRPLSVDEYEAVERARDALIDQGDYVVPTDALGGWYRERYGGRRLLVFRGMKDYYRQYQWS